jgi:hypothetical protein
VNTIEGTGWPEGVPPVGSFVHDTIMRWIVGLRKFTLTATMELPSESP